MIAAGDVTCPDDVDIDIVLACSAQAIRPAPPISAFTMDAPRPAPSGDEELIPFPGISAWTRAAALCRFNITPAFAKAGVHVSPSGEHFVSRRGVIELMRYCVAQAAPTHHFPLVAGDCHEFDVLPALATFLATSSTLRDAIPVIEWSSRMLSGVDIRFEDDPKAPAIVIELERRPGDPPEVAGYFAEDMVASLCKHGRLLLGGRPLAVAVDFMHDPGPVRAMCEMQFGVPVRVRQARNALVLSRALLDQRLPGALPDLHHHLHGIIEHNLPPGPRFSGSVAGRIAAVFRQDPQWMGQGIGRVAEHLKLHPRTLQRRLKDEGQTFAELQNRCRCEHACEQLRGGTASIHELSEQLGFADRNSFTQSFKQWMGLTPTEWRKREQAGVTAPSSSTGAAHG